MLGHLTVSWEPRARQRRSQKKPRSVCRLWFSRSALDSDSQTPLSTACTEAPPQFAPIKALWSPPEPVTWYVDCVIIIHCSDGHGAHFRVFVNNNRKANQHKSVSSLVPRLSTRHCPRLLLSAGACYRPTSSTRRALSSKPAARRCCCRSMAQTDRQTDGRSTVT